MRQSRTKSTNIRRLDKRLGAICGLGILVLAGAAQGAERRIEFENGDVYVGEVVDGERTGRGIYTWANGSRYEGQFLANRMHGQGVLTLHDTGSYEGPFIDGKMHGSGVFTWPDGRRYEGQFADGSKAGLGTLTWPNGNLYRGEFADDERTGLGTLFWRDGTVFHGQFAAGMMQGYGVKRTPDGSMELQQWQGGNLEWAQALAEEARCRLRMLDRRWMFDGASCINGLAHGQGLAVSLDGDYIVIDGHFVLGRLVAGNPEPLKRG